MSRVLPVRRWWAKRELVWYRLVWLDGRRDRSHIDTGGLWSVIQPLKDGRFELLDIRGLVLDARRLTGHERDVLWHRYMD